MNIEILEPRIAPASVLLYTDVDGDKVKVTSSSATGDISSVATLHPTGNGGMQLYQLLLDDAFAGTNLTVSVTRVPGGDGLANVGYIRAPGVNLGNVIVKGDLGVIDAGNDTDDVPAIKSLSVRSMGRFGNETSGGAGFMSKINGAIGALKVAGDVIGATIQVGFGENGTIGSIFIGGSLIGGTTNFSGTIFCTGDIGKVKIGRDVRGGSAEDCGEIATQGKLAGVSIGGSLIGGLGNISGFIGAKDMGPVKIGRNLQGGAGSLSGIISCNGVLAGVTVGGSVIGGSNSTSGGISSTLDIGAVKIGHDLIGGSVNFTASLDRSGFIRSNTGRIASVTVGGSIIAGADNSTGTLNNSGSIRAEFDIGSLVVKGSLIGNPGASFQPEITPVVISARGQEFPTLGVNLAIGSITIGGSVDRANILAGYDQDLNPVNGDAQIGAVKVGGDWAASNLVAGALNMASGNKTFGDGADASIGAGSANITAKIASVVIKGEVYGQPGISGTFGFVAQQIGSFKFNGAAIVLTAGAGNDKFAGAGLAGNARPAGPSLSATIDDGFAVHVFEV